MPIGPMRMPMPPCTYVTVQPNPNSGMGETSTLLSFVACKHDERASKIEIPAEAQAELRNCKEPRTQIYNNMAAKLIANLIVLGSGVVLRAVSQAYRQALVNASKSGVAQETVQNMAHKVSKTMSEHEARQILGVTEKASWEEIMKKYDTLFENNAKAGTFYVQSKVFRAKECLEAARQQASQGERPA